VHFTGVHAAAPAALLRRARRRHRWWVISCLLLCSVFWCDCGCSCTCGVHTNGAVERIRPSYGACCCIPQSHHYVCCTSHPEACSTGVGSPAMFLRLPTMHTHFITLNFLHCNLCRQVGAAGRAQAGGISLGPELLLPALADVPHPAGVLMVMLLLCFVVILRRYWEYGQS